MNFMCVYSKAKVHTAAALRQWQFPFNDTEVEIASVFVSFVPSHSKGNNGQLNL